MKTFMASPATINRKWYVVDATDQTLGRLASEVAKVLRGKNKAIFTPHMDCGDYVIVVNAEKVKVTGKKLDQKIYYHHSDYVGGMKETTLREDGQEARAGDRVGCQGHAAQGAFRKTDVHQTACICGAGAQARCPEARSTDILKD